jgi:hypothetical protein
VTDTDPTPAARRTIGRGTGPDAARAREKEHTMRPTTAAISLALAAGLATAAPHESSFEIHNGRASLLGFSSPSAVAFRLDMAPDTASPATGTYAIHMPDAGTMCEVWINGFFGFDMNGDGESDMGFGFEPVMVDNAFSSPGTGTAWSSPYAVDIGDFEIDLTPFGLATVIGFNDVTLTLLGGDTDNPAPAGELGPGAFMDFELSADIVLDGPAELPPPDLFGPGGLFSMRYNAELGFLLIPTPASLTLLALTGAVAHRRRAS